MMIQAMTKTEKMNKTMSCIWTYLKCLPRDRMPRINLKNVIGSVLLLILSNISMTDEDLGDEDDESTADDSDDESALEESESDSQQDDGNLDKLSAFVDALSAK